MAGALLLSLMAACTGPTDPTSDPTQTVSGSVSPSPAPSPTSDRERAEQSARATVDRYYALLDDLASDGSQPLSRLDEGLTGGYLEAWRAELERSRNNGWTQKGGTRVVSVTTQGVTTSPDGSATAVFDTCYDVSEVDVVDASGASVVPAERPDRGWSRLTMTSTNFADDDWRVTAGETLEKEPCAEP
ncbi:hypothetical protein [Antribacter gilvus]|uniref:hypothetical protein n=1 Tax=Antribacter gilvus TaxID=2304675 RepID=UPI000F7B1A0F|nr:hypothetical protein [Antribacter gilvus]